MSLLALVPIRSWLMGAGAVIAGLIGGASGAALIALINTALNRAGLSRTLLVAGFAGLVAAKVMSNAVARLLLNRFSQRTLADLCRDLTARCSRRHSVTSRR